MAIIKIHVYYFTDVRLNYKIEGLVVLFDEKCPMVTNGGVSHGGKVIDLSGRIRASPDDWWILGITIESLLVISFSPK